MRNGLVKIAMQISAPSVSPERKTELRDTVVIAGMGGIGNTIADRLLHGKSGGGAKAFAAGTGIGLAADYGAVRLNKLLAKRLDSEPNKE